jgi:hypothetical protein
MRLDADDETATLVDEDGPFEGRPSDVDSKAPTAVEGEEGERPDSRDEDERRIAQGADES